MERILFGRVSSGQLAQFCRQFAAYLNAGVDFTRALSSLEQQFSGTALGPIVGRLQLSIRRGSTLEEAMAREPQAFGPMFRSMIKVAEARGGVPETLRMLGQHYENRQRLIRQVRSAMIYPVIVLVAAGGVIALITIKLLPMFASLLRDISRNSQLPFASRALLAFSHFVEVIGWWLIPVILIGTPFLLFRLYKTQKGKQILDRLILLTPVFGLLCRKLDTTRFARTLSVLLDAGVDVGSSIDLTADVLMMSPIQKAVRSSREQIIAGKELSVTLAKAKQFGPDVIAVIASGEETGKLPESLNHLADDYEEQVSTMVANLGHLIQPLLIIILGGIVLFIILAVLLPYIQVLTSLSGG
jgi:type II secretory pathway component PulF